MTVGAHFDGKVIVPDEPLDLRPNQALRIQIEPIEGDGEESALSWIAANAVDSDALPTDLADQHDHYLYGRPQKGQAQVVATYFADTPFWLGLSRKRDQHHARAVAWHQFLIRTRNTILTTEAVLLEWLNAMSDVSTRRIAAESCLRARADARIEVVPFDAEMMIAAIEFYRDRPDKNWSLTDCLSFVVMQRRDLTEALTTDHDFEQAGLRALMLSLPGV